MEENIPTEYDIDTPLKQTDLKILAEAKHAMEHPTWLMKSLNMVGDGLESTVRKLPNKVQIKLQNSIEKILMTTIKANLLTIQKDKEFQKPKKGLYKGVVTLTGGASGFFGSATGVGTALFFAELGVSTKFIMRSIMDIARSEGEDIYSLEGQLACMEVFALGGQKKWDDDMEASYYTTRYMLSTAVNQLTHSGLNKTLATAIAYTGNLGSDMLSKFVSNIAGRLSALFSEKFLTQAVPVIGAAGGSGLNYVYIDHFQKMAKAHFAIRRLEREYGQEVVKKAFEKL